MRADRVSTARVVAQRASAGASLRWRGTLEGHENGLVFGWCIDTEQPDARVVLELCLNGSPIGTFSADVARSDLLARFKRAFPAKTPIDNCHGFAGSIAFDTLGTDGVVTVRVANTDVILPGVVEVRAGTAPPAAAWSQVFSDGGLRLLGWARMPVAPRAVSTVSAYLNGEVIAQAKANTWHPSLNVFSVGARGFCLDLPLTLADGKSHRIDVLDDATGPLNGSPITVCCYADGAKTLLPPDHPLGPVIDNFERYVPRSLGMRHYAQWAAAFEQSVTQTPAATPNLRVGLIITGASNPVLIECTLSNLKAQTGLLPVVFNGCGPDAFTESLGQALRGPIDLIGCVRSGDCLPSHALAVARSAFIDERVQLAYTDSVYQDQPWFKPAWDPEYAVASDYPLELMLTRVPVAQALFAGQPLPPDPAAFSWRLLSNASPGGQIVHIPRVLYEFKTPLNAQERHTRTAAAQQFISASEPRSRVSALPDPPAAIIFEPRRIHRVLDPKARRKTVTIIIPTRERAELLDRCIQSIRAFTAWPRLEILVVDNGSVLPETKTYLARLRRENMTILSAPGPFNFARLNNLAVAAAKGEIVGLVNNDIEALHSGWLDEILSQLLRPAVGAVGAKLLWPNGMVQHGGVLLGQGNAAGHFGNLLADEQWGNQGRNQLVQQVSAVTAACLFMRKRDYLRLGGMDEAAFPVAFNDVDLCLRLRCLGKSIIWTPHAKLLHAESASRGTDDTPQKRARAQRELAQLRTRWGDTLLHDPAYHPSLNLDPHGHAYGGLAIPPRDRTPRLPGLVMERR